MPEPPLLRVLLVDDEPLARERARRLLTTVGDTEIVGECDNGHAAIMHIETDPPDVVLLDVNMPGIDGLRVIEALDDPPAIILATAYEHHAVKAFELQVTDYLLKPFSAERLRRALDRVRRHLGARPQSGVMPETSHATPDNVKIPADAGSGVELIPASQLAAARIDEGVVFLLRTDGESFCFSGTLQELEALLPGYGFFRSSRSALLNLQAVQRYTTCLDGGLHVDLQGGYQLKVSRRRARFFRAAIR